MFSFVENLKFEGIFKNKIFIEYLKAMKIDEEIKGYAEVEIELISLHEYFKFLSALKIRIMILNK